MNLNKSNRPSWSKRTTCAKPAKLPSEEGPVVGQPVSNVDWFRHMPNSGATVYLKPTDEDLND